MRSRLMTAFLCGCCVLGPAPTAAASGDGGTGAWVESASIVATARSGGQGRPGGPRRAKGAHTCTYSHLAEQWAAAPAGDWYVRRCRDRDGTESAWSVVYREDGAPDANVDPETMALEALDRVALPLPTPAMSPDPERLMVHVPTWLWLEGGWQPVSASASVPGVSVRVTASPEAVTWDMGNGDEVVCRGSGTAYDRSRPQEEQSTDCSYTYRRSSAGQPRERFAVTATMRWQVTWTATGDVPGGGALGEVTRSTSVDVRVAEGQALVGSERR